MSPKNKDPGLAWLIAVMTLCRLVLNTARRFAYPFAPVLSRGLGVPLTAVTSLIAVNQAAGLLGFVFGPLADRRGYRLMMMAGLGLLAAGLLTGGCLPFYPVILGALFVAGLGKNMFDPALQAYIGRRVPYARRGLAIGMLEISWAASTLVGIPLIGLLMDRLGWRASFFALGGGGLIGLLALRLVIPRNNRPADREDQSAGFGEAWRLLVREKTALATLGYTFLVAAANDNLFVVYGAWLEKSFHLSVIALGLGTSVIGIAELLGESLTAGLADRFGLKRSVLTGLALTVVAYGLLPLMGRNLGLALTGLFLVFMAFEFMIVSSLSLSTELVPGARATMMSFFLAFASLGRIFGALIGGPIWLAGGIAATGLVSVLLSGLALAVLAWGLRGWRRS